MTESRMQSHEDQAIREVSARLQIRFKERTGADVARVVNAVARRFATVPIRDFIPLLVERIARDELNHRVLKR